MAHPWHSVSHSQHFATTFGAHMGVDAMNAGTLLLLMAVGLVLYLAATGKLITVWDTLFKGGKAA